MKLQRRRLRLRSDAAGPGVRVSLRFGRPASSRVALRAVFTGVPGVARIGTDRFGCLASGS